MRSLGALDKVNRADDILTTAMTSVANVQDLHAGLPEVVHVPMYTWVFTQTQLF